MSARDFILSRPRHRVTPGAYFIAISSRSIQIADGKVDSNSMYLDLVAYRVDSGFNFEQLDAAHALIAHAEIRGQPGAEVAEYYLEHIIAEIKAGKFAGRVQGPLGIRHYALCIYSDEVGFEPYTSGASQPVAEGRAKKFISSLKGQVEPIRAGDFYYVALGAPPLNLSSEETEFCPFGIYSDNVQQHDGMYGLLDDVEKHFNFVPTVQRYSDHPKLLSYTDEQDEQISAAQGTYLSAIHAGLRKGIGGGIINGVIGPREWRLVREAQPNVYVPIGDHFMAVGLQD